MSKKFEVYEEDPSGNTWKVASFPSLMAAEQFKNRMYRDAPEYKIREVE